jgi:hypothetical protein
VLAFGASIYGSYRYEPSGVQYALLPGIASPVCLALGITLLVAGRKLRAPIALYLLPFLAAAILYLPGIDMPLSNRNLEMARWATVMVGFVHVLLLVLLVKRERAHAGYRSLSA